MKVKRVVASFVALAAVAVPCVSASAASADEGGSASPDALPLMPNLSIAPSDGNGTVSYANVIAQMTANFNAETGGYLSALMSSAPVDLSNPRAVMTGLENQATYGATVAPYGYAGVKPDDVIPVGGVSPTLGTARLRQLGFRQATDGSGKVFWVGPVQAAAASKGDSPYKLASG